MSSGITLVDAYRTFVLWTPRLGSSLSVASSTSGRLCMWTTWGSFFLLVHNTVETDILLVFDYTIFIN